MRINTQIHKFLTRDPISARVLLKTVTHQKTGWENSCILPSWVFTACHFSVVSCAFLVETVQRSKGRAEPLDRARCGCWNPQKELLAVFFPGVPFCMRTAGTLSTAHANTIAIQSLSWFVTDSWATYFAQLNDQGLSIIIKPSRHKPKTLHLKVIKHFESRKPTERNYAEGLKPSLNTCWNLLYYNLSKKTGFFEKH